MKLEKSWIWGVFGWLCLITSVVFGGKAYDKMFNYYNAEYATSLSKNAYVGGDAYNYIINSNYTTAMCVMCIGFLIVGLGCIAYQQWRNTYVDAISNQKMHLESISNNISKQSE